MSAGIGRAVVALVFWAGLCEGAVRERVNVFSPRMAREIAVLTVAPAHTHPDSTFPVVYLLHGHGVSPDAWLQAVRLGSLSDRHHVIFACPAGDTSWWLDSPRNPSVQFASFVALELVPAIDSLLPTRADRAGRALLGSSMGGNGALGILSRFPGTFCAAGSIGGALDLREWDVRWGLEHLLGPVAGNESAWEEHGAAWAVQHLDSTACFVVLDCGRSDPALRSNRVVRDLLQRGGVEHRYHEGDGGHERRYVAKRFEDVLRELLARLPAH